jgi:hypothetical protein
LKNADIFERSRDHPRFSEVLSKCEKIQLFNPEYIGLIPLTVKSFQSSENNLSLFDHLETYKYCGDGLENIRPGSDIKFLSSSCNSDKLQLNQLLARTVTSLDLESVSTPYMDLTNLVEYKMLESLEVISCFKDHTTLTFPQKLSGNISYMKLHQVKLKAFEIDVPVIHLEFSWVASGLEKITFSKNVRKITVSAFFSDFPVRSYNHLLNNPTADQIDIYAKLEIIDALQKKEIKGYDQISYDSFTIGWKRIEGK